MDECKVTHHLIVVVVVVVVVQGNTIEQQQQQQQQHGQAAISVCLSVLCVISPKGETKCAHVNVCVCVCDRQPTTHTHPPTHTHTTKQTYTRQKQRKMTKNQRFATNHGTLRYRVGTAKLQDVPKLATTRAKGGSCISKP